MPCGGGLAPTGATAIDGLLTEAEGATTLVVAVEGRTARPGACASPSWAPIWSTPIAMPRGAR